MAYEKPLRIIIAAPLWTSVRDLLRSSVLPDLLSSGAYIHIVSPSANDPVFIKEFVSERVSVSKMVTPSNRVRLRLESLFAYVGMICMARYIETWRIKIQTSSKWRFWPLRAAFRLICFLPEEVAYNMNRFFRKLRYLATEDALYGELFDDFEPDLVVLNMPYFGGSRFLDRYLLVEAKRRGIKCALVVASWDNLTGKASLPCLPDAMLVWNDTMRREAIELHGMPAEATYVCGAPCHDFFVQTWQRHSEDRSTFYRIMGLDSNRKLITYACTAPKVLPDEHILVETIYHSLRENFADIPWQLLIRSHPSGNLSDFSKVAKLPNVHVHHPGRHLDGSVGKDIDYHEIHLFESTLRYSAVVINYFSTVIIDAAAMGCPCINFIKADDYNHSTMLTPLRFLGYNHIMPLLSEETVLYVTTLEDLMRLVRTCVLDRDSYRHVRERLVRQQCWRLDGLSGKRTSHALLAFARGVPADRLGPVIAQVTGAESTTDRTHWALLGTAISPSRLRR